MSIIFARNSDAFDSWSRWKRAVRELEEQYPLRNGLDPRQLHRERSIRSRMTRFSSRDFPRQLDGPRVSTASTIVLNASDSVSGTEVARTHPIGHSGGPPLPSPPAAVSTPPPLMQLVTTIQA